MKLKMTLPSRPGLIYTLPSIDILVLVLIIPLLGSSFKSNTGVEITLADSMHRIPQLDTVQLSIKGRVNPRIWVNQREVTREDLLKAIEVEMEDNSETSSVAVALHVDKMVPSGFVKDIQEMLLLAHYRVFDIRNPAKK